LGNRSFYKSPQSIKLLKAYHKMYLKENGSLNAFLLAIDEILY
jgi:hypothetical protein